MSGRLLVQQTFSISGSGQVDLRSPQSASALRGQWPMLHLASHAAQGALLRATPRKRRDGARLQKRPLKVLDGGTSSESITVLQVQTPLPVDIADPSVSLSPLGPTPPPPPRLSPLPLPRSLAQVCLLCAQILRCSGKRSADQFITFADPAWVVPVSIKLNSSIL